MLFRPWAQISSVAPLTRNHLAAFAPGDGTFQAYQLPEIGDWMGYGCSGQRLCNAYKGMWVYRTQWMLPKDFVCDHCKLQWVSVTRVSSPAIISISISIIPIADYTQRHSIGLAAWGALQGCA